MEEYSLMAVQGAAAGRVVLVLGMHRSGTSAVAAGLEQLGVVMGSALLQADEWNPKGYFEEKQLVEFNNRLLGLSGLRWDSLALPSPEGMHAWQDENNAAGDLLDDIFGDAALWGFKDPRMCLLGKFWKPLLASRGVFPRLLLVLRNPAEVAHSLARRDGICVERSAWLWFIHLLGSLQYVDEQSDSCMIDFAELLSSPALTLRIVAEWIGLPPDHDSVERFASDFIAPQLSHGAAGCADSIPLLVVRAFDYWQAVASCKGSVWTALHDPQWLSIRREFEEQVLPRLSLIQQFFDGDKQLSVLEGRVGKLSHALAVSERLAFDRLDQVLKLDSQLKQTSGALAFAEQLALHRQQLLEQVEQASAWGREKAVLEETVKQLSCGLERCEALAVERLAVIERMDAQLHATCAALAHAEQVVASLQSAEQSTQSALQQKRIEELEALANQRLEQLHALDEQVVQTTEGLAHASQIVENQVRQLSSQHRQIQDLEQLALQRQAEIEMLGQEHREMELFARQRQEELQALQDAQHRLVDHLKDVESRSIERECALSDGLAQAEQFAFSRLEQINRLNEELKQLTDALAHAQRLVAARSASQES